MTFKENLEKYIEREVSDIYVGPLTEASRYHFQKCADLLMPMLIEAVEALKFYKDAPSFWPHNGENHGFAANDALAKIEAQLGVEK